MLKSHPGSDYSDIVKETVPEIVSLPGYFPFELLNFEELKISRIFNMGSTSTRFINTDIDLVEVPQAAYFDHYPEMNALSISLHLSKYLYGELPNVFCGLQHWSEALAPLLACFAEGIYLVKSEDVDHLVNMRIIGDDQIERDSVIEKHEKFDRKSCTVVINPSVASAKLFSDNAVIIKIKKIECTSNAINYVGDLDSEYIMLISNNEKIIDATKKYTAKKHMKRCGIELDCSSMSIKDFIIEKQNLSGSIVFRTARMGNEEALKCIQNWLKKTYASVTPGENELFDHILDTFYDIISTLAYSDAGIAMGFFGSMYRDGRGVKRDLDKAAEWMRKAADKNVGWAKNELFVIIEESQAAEK
ncbi:MAG: hypothetical protein LHW59_10680 [Candidatus Cloacimonetes bacterium]|nr:hypothetical protein [Candidatus Cloacimonadota bacterium]